MSKINLNDRDYFIAELTDEEMAELDVFAEECNCVDEEDHELEIIKASRDRLPSLSFSPEDEAYCEELKAKTLKLMQQARAAQMAEKAAEPSKILSLPHKSESSKTFWRGIAIAAVIALIISVTPIGDRIVSYAKDLYKMLYQRIESTFSIDLMTEDEVIDIEIIEGKLADDGLYLTIAENSWLYRDNPIKTISDGNITYTVYPTIVMDYSGEIRDDKGKVLTFSSDDVEEVEFDGVLITRPKDQYEGSLKQIRIAPRKLMKFLSKKDRSYYCTLNVSFYEQYSDRKGEDILSTTFSFEIVNK